MEEAVSARNGDKARFGRQRNRKLARRKVNRQFGAVPAPGKSAVTKGVPGP